MISQFSEYSASIISFIPNKSAELVLLLALYICKGEAGKEARKLVPWLAGKRVRTESMSLTLHSPVSVLLSLSYLILTVTQLRGYHNRYFTDEQAEAERRSCGLIRPRFGRGLW